VNTGVSGSTALVTVNLKLPDPYATGASAPVSTPNTPALTYLLQAAPAVTYACAAPSPLNGTISGNNGSGYFRTLSFLCSVQAPSVAFMGLPNTLAVQAKNYNFGVPDSTYNKNSTPSLPCTGTGTAVGQPSVNLTGNTTYTVNKCYNFAASTPIVFSPAGATGAIGTVASDHLKAESTQINASVLNNNDSITVPFTVSTTFTKLCSDATLPVGSSCIMQPSCTYTCTMSGTSCAANSQVFSVATPANCN